MPRESRYNHFHPWRDGARLAYNALSGGVALISDEHYAAYRRLTGDAPSLDDSSPSAEDQTLLEQLRYGHFVCDDDVDERGSLRFRHNSTRFDNTAMALVIAPTLACNMACEYCYESNKKGRMSVPVIESVIAFVEERARHLAALEVSWYGGEPLLAIDIIEDLTETFLDLAKEKDFAYSASIITNGVLLEPEMVDRLVELKVGTVQVTIDGPAHVHDRKRPLKNGEKSFHTILDNLRYASSKMAVGIRVNVDQSFSPRVIEELLDELEAAGLQNKVRLYFGRLEPSTQACANISESCFGSIGFAGAETEYYRLLLQRGFPIEKLPAPMPVFCMAQQVNSFVVDPQGYLYQCWNHVGDHERSFGNIGASVDYQHPNFRRLFEVDPFDDAECRECGLLPVCMGGCPSRRVDREVAHDDFCESWKYNLGPMLEVIAASRQAAAQAATAQASAERASKDAAAPAKAAEMEAS